MINLNRRSFLAYCPGVVALTAGTRKLIASSADRAARLHIGAQTNTFGVPIKGYDHLLEILDTLAGLGYQGFETNELSLATYADRAAVVRRAFESRHVPLIAPHTGGKLGLEGSDSTDAEIERLHRIAGWGAQMGAKYLIFSAGRLSEQDGKLDTQQVRRRMDDLNRLGRLCAQEGIDLCYHNERQEFNNDPSEMSALLRETDPKLVRLCFDIGNGYGLGEDPGPFSARHYKRIAIYHLKDVKRNADDRVVPVDLGAGAVDIRSVLAPVLNSNWQGWLNVEREGNYPKAADNPADLLKQCREYIRQATNV